MKRSQHKSTGEQFLPFSPVAIAEKDLLDLCLSSEDGLPPSWVRATIADLTEASIDQSGPEKEGQFLYVDISSIDNQAKCIAVPRILPGAQAPNRARQRLKPRDVLVSMTRPNLNAVATVPPEMNGAIGSTGFYVIRALGIEPAWLYYAVQTHAFITAMSQLTQGVLYPAVRPRDIRAHTVPLAPLREQRRIVAEIEKQFTRLEAAVAALKRVRANLKRYRASVLKVACGCRLVPTEAELARTENRTYEPADKLLARILKERRARWEVGQLVKMHAAGKPPKDDKWKTKYKEPTSPNTSNLPLLPEGWAWATVDQLLSDEPGSLQSGPFGSNLHHSEFGAVGILAIGIDNVLDGTFSLGREHRITRGKFAELEKYAARPLDVLVTVMATLGRCCVVPTETEQAIITKHVYRITVNQQIVAPKYLMTCVRGAAPVREQLLRKARGRTRPGLNGEILRHVAIPIPPSSEQHRIVAELERRLSVIDELEGTVDANLKRAAGLQQAILKRAFEGRLVPQDPSDEPASALLERIRAERHRPVTQSKGMRSK